MESGYETHELLLRSYTASQMVDDLNGAEWGDQEWVYFCLIRQVQCICSFHTLIFMIKWCLYLYKCVASMERNLSNAK